MAYTTRKPHSSTRRTLFDVVNGARHRRAVLIYLVIVLGHFSEHLMQAAQVFVFGWPRSEAGGILGLVLSGVAESELLHITYNSFQLTGLILLAYGFRRHRAAYGFWIVAAAVQSWHWLEHALLIAQLLTGHYLYGAIKQMSVLERFVPRIELHFAYNLLVFVPTAIAVVLYWRAASRRRVARR